jgi:hypothetical protein
MSDGLDLIKLQKMFFEWPMGGKAKSRCSWGMLKVKNCKQIEA